MLQDLGCVLALGASSDLLPLQYQAAKRLLLAVLAQAVRDAKSKQVPMYRETARYWLITQGAEIAQLIGLCIQQQDIETWIQADCPNRFLADPDSGTEVDYELQGLDV